MDDDKTEKPPKRVRLSPHVLRRIRPEGDNVVNINGRKVRSVGQPPFVPTDDEKRLVQTMVANGIPQPQICLCIHNPYTGKPIERHTLTKAFSYEIQVAKAQVDALVGSSLVQRALGRSPKVLLEETTTDGKTKVKKQVIDPGCEPDTTAIIWYEKTRRGFREGHVIEHTGPNGEPLPAQQVQVNISHNVIVLPQGRSAQEYVAQLPKSD